jgi:NADPH:quinone reductase-like Zn-dependent oxidoreductase
VSAWGENPKFTPSAPLPEAPAADSSLVQVKVIAAGLHNLVRAQASGQQYSALKAGLPYTLGADGVGLTPDNTLVYFNVIPTGGAMAEYVNVPKQAIFPVRVPETASEAEKKETAIRVASLANPAMASWFALRTRTANLPPNYTVIILGVTSLSGRVAIPLARHLGAGKIIGVARNTKAMAALDLDQTVELKGDVSSADLGNALEDTHVDVVLDYLYGAPALHLLNSFPSDPILAKQIQYVQIGTLAGVEMSVPAALLRSKNIVLRGTGPGSWSVGQMSKEFPEMIATLVKGVGEFEVKQRPLEDAVEAWKDTRGRTVFVL